MTIQEMWKRVLEIRGEQETKVTIEFWQYGPSIGEREIKLSLWDGYQHYDASSLEDLILLAKARAAEKIEVSNPSAIDGELPEMEKPDEPAS